VLHLKQSKTIKTLS